MNKKLVFVTMVAISVQVIAWGYLAVLLNRVDWGLSFTSIGPDVVLMMYVVCVVGVTLSFSLCVLHSFKSFGSILLLCLSLSALGCFSYLNLSGKVGYKDRSDNVVDYEMLLVEAREILLGNKKTNDFSGYPTIYSLNPKKIKLSKEGLFIILKKGFVEESGLFVPNKSVDFSERVGEDPEFILLENGVYRYKIRG